MTVIEGGIVEGSGNFECTHGSHSEPFKTTDIKEFNEHLSQEGHFIKGAAPCVLCDSEVNLDNNPLPVGEEVLCGKCIDRLLKRNANKIPGEPI